MKAGWWIGIVMAYLILVIICSVCEQQAAPFTATHTNLVTTLLDPPKVDWSWNIIASAGSMISAGATWVSALWGTFWFNFSFMEQSTLGQYFHMFCLCIPMGLVIMWVSSLIRGATGG